MKAVFLRSPSGTLRSSTVVEFFCTGRDLPVSEASSTWKVYGLPKPDVGWNVVPGVQEDHVAGYQFAGRYRLPSAFPEDLRLRRRQFLQKLPAPAPRRS